MPSNKDLVKAIADISAELEKDAPETEGKNNGDLANILSGLKAGKAKAKAAKKAKKPPFYVMPGKCLTSKRGMLATERDAGISDYAEIKADDLAGGKDALTAFVESGHVGEA